MNDMEKNQVSESEDFAAMLEETMVKFRPGQVVKGVVAQVSDDGVVVSIPGKADGFIKKNDLVTTDCKVDDEIEAEVVKLNDGEGYVLLSERNGHGHQELGEARCRIRRGRLCGGYGS